LAIFVAITRCPGQHEFHIGFDLLKRLDEHTIKKYLYRIFEKLGISTRVELVLYAVNNGDPRHAEWLAGGSRIVPNT